MNNYQPVLMNLICGFIGSLFTIGIGYFVAWKQYRKSKQSDIRLKYLIDSYGLLEDSVNRRNPHSGDFDEKYER